VDAVRAEGKGNVQLSLGAGSTRDLGTPGGRFEHSLSGYVIASIPLFNQAEQQARETQALAQVASREAALTQVERDIESDLWRNANGCWTPKRRT
jgi:outer membrane protein TolC